MTYTVDKTPLGMEYVIPGTEQVVKPRRRAFKADGDQHVIPGAEQILDKEIPARLAEKPMSPRRGQIGLCGTALFGARP
jgi:hypothetical protein